MHSCYFDFTQRIAVAVGPTPTHRASFENQRRLGMPSLINNHHPHPPSPEEGTSYIPALAVGHARCIMGPPPAAITHPRDAPSTTHPGPTHSDLPPFLLRQLGFDLLPPHHVVSEKATRQSWRSWTQFYITQHVCLHFLLQAPTSLWLPRLLSSFASSTFTVFLPALMLSCA